MLRFLKRIVLSVLLIGIIVCGVFTYLGYQKYKMAVEQEPLKQKVEVIYSSNDFVALADLPKMYKEAVVAVEDRRFYQHQGVDYIGIIRALINDIRYMELREGGSSITQQLAKNLYFEGETSLQRKVAEVFVAFDLEKNYSKSEILEMYVNSIYFGNGYYGVGQASRGYFGKMAKHMTDAESTMLAGIPNAPSAYAFNKHKDKAIQRQKQVLRRMVKNGYLTEEEAEKMVYKE